MTFTTTGIAFTFSSIGLAFCSIKFFKAFRNMGDLRSGKRIGILLSTLFLGFSIQHGILAIGGLFFSQTPKALYATLIIDHIVLTFITPLAVYIATYILLPKISPWLPTISVFIFAIFINILTAREHFLPFVTTANSINWNMPHRIELLWYILLLLGIGVPFLIFTKNFFLNNTRNVRNISLFMALVHFAGIINVSVIFGGFLSRIGEVQLKVFDIVLVIIGIGFIFTFLILPLITRWKIKNRKA